MRCEGYFIMVAPCEADEQKFLGGRRVRRIVSKFTRESVSTYSTSKFLDMTS